MSPHVPVKPLQWDEAPSWEQWSVTPQLNLPIWLTNWPASFINNDCAQRAEGEGSRSQFIYRRTLSPILQNNHIAILSTLYRASATEEREEGRPTAPPKLPPPFLPPLFWTPSPLPLPRYITSCLRSSQITFWEITDIKIYRRYQ